jgi:DNA invertase Pin-like site-specific DNA recombinase
MRFFGYARVSTSQQSLEIQKQVLKNAGVKESRIFFDKSTGGNIDRPGLNSLLVKGIKFGRKRKIDRDKLLKYKEKGIIGTALAKEMGISRSTVYKILKEEKNRALVN